MSEGLGRDQEVPGPGGAATGSEWIGLLPVGTAYRNSPSSPF